MVTGLIPSHFVACVTRSTGTKAFWCRISSGNTIDLVFFVHAVPVGEEESFGPLLAARTKYFFDVSCKRKSNITGKAALNYICDLPRGSTGGLGKFCLDKGGRDADKAAKIMKMEIDAHFRGVYSLQYDVSLNRFMVDWDTFSQRVCWSHQMG